MVVASTGKKQAESSLRRIRRRCIREPRNIFVNLKQRDAKRSVPRLMISMANEANECPFFDGLRSRDKASTYARRYFSHEKYETRTDRPFFLPVF